jgi:SAM-dependent methyltransferase
VLAELPAKARVIDLGVGTGRELSALLDAGHAPTGVDLSPMMLERCARRARPVPLVEADLWGALPFDDGAFDAALALHGTLAHPPDGAAHARLASELARVLVPGGVVVAEVPARAWLDRIAVGGEIASDDRRVRRTGADDCVYDDLVTGVSIAAWIPDDARWATLLGPRFDARVTAIGSEELLVVARRAR